ncbi:MAG: hypothetical protein IT368_18630 [Candidatus Hydrogenedentes bacterium]|nr:hypothetical protein [Candidatus Hydrogenedentota bacterium]
MLDFKPPDDMYFISKQTFKKGNSIMLTKKLFSFGAVIAAGAVILAGGLQAFAQDEEAKPAKKETPKKVWVNAPLVMNSSFESWQKGSKKGDNIVPKKWTVQNAGGIERLAKAPYAGKYSVRLNEVPGSKTWVVLEFPVKADKSVLGGKAEASVVARASAQDLLGVGIKYQANGETFRTKTYHPGTGEWRTLTVSADIPKDADPKSIVLEIFREPGKKGDAAADLALMEIKK